MKKIAVILTGGTIGARIAQDDLINVDQGAAYRLLALYRETYGDDVSFEVINPFNVLSENMHPGYWESLCAELSKLDLSDCSGVIITHGTDTLAYTSALVGYLFHYLPVPVVLIASNYALGESGSNGLINFRSAVDLIREQKLSGVYVIYADGTDNVVFLSTRLLSADSYQDRFGSYGGVPFGRMRQGIFVPYEQSVNPSALEVSAKKDRVLTKPVSLSDTVPVIYPYPGMDYRMFDLSSGPKCILHCLYHSATACTQVDEYSVCRFMERCNKQGTTVYLASFKNEDARMYVTSREMLAMGAVPLYNISAEAAYMKLLLAYNQNEYPAEELMKRNLFFESLPMKN